MAICEKYQGYEIANLDESSLPIKTLGNYSHVKKSRDPLPRACNDWLSKERFTIVLPISKTGTWLFKPLIIDSGRDEHNFVLDFYDLYSCLANL